MDAAFSLPTDTEKAEKNYSGDLPCLHLINIYMLWA